MKRMIQLLVCSFIVSGSAAFADPIIGTSGATALTSYVDSVAIDSPATAQPTRRTNGSSTAGPSGAAGATAFGVALFDATGTPVLLAAPAEHLDIGAHPKYNDSLISDAVIGGMQSGVLSGVNFSSGGGSVQTSAAPVSAPEPGTVVMLATGLSFVARRLVNTRAQRRRAR